MSNLGKKLHQGFILLDAVIGLIIMALVLACGSAFFFSLSSSAARREKRLLEYLDTREELVLEFEYEF